MKNISDITFTNCSGQEIFENPVITDHVCVVIILSMLTIFIFLTNLFVVYTIIFNENLRNPQNILLASLALSDLSLAVFVLPLDIVNGFYGVWPSSGFWCSFWIFSDISLCTASILNLVVISLDRFWAITNPIQYIEKRTYTRMFFMLALVWGISMLLSAIPVTIFDLLECGICDLSKNKIYVIISSIISFYVPIIIILIIYAKIYKALKIRREQKLKRMSHLNDTLKKNKSSSNFNLLKIFPFKSTASISDDDNSFERLAKIKYKFFMSKERRAAFTLVFLLGSFVVCWLPFSVCYLFTSIFPQKDISLVYRITAWIGFINSLINPFIYTFSNKDLRGAFYDTLKRLFYIRS